MSEPRETPSVVDWAAVSEAWGALSLDMAREQADAGFEAWSLTLTNLDALGDDDE
jgi:hypothetical protein